MLTGLHSAALLFSGVLDQGSNSLRSDFQARISARGQNLGQVPGPAQGAESGAEPKWMPGVESAMASYNRSSFLLRHFLICSMGFYGAKGPIRSLQGDCQLSLSVRTSHTIYPLWFVSHRELPVYSCS